MPPVRHTPNFGLNPITEAIGSGRSNQAPLFFGASDCQRPSGDLFAVDRNIKPPYMENYNLNIQQQISSKVALQVGYVGSQGHRLWRFFDINQPTAQGDPQRSMPRRTRDPAWDRLQRHDRNCTRFVRCTARSSLAGPKGTFYIFQREFQWQIELQLAASQLAGITGKSDGTAITSVVNFVWSRSMDNSSDGEDFVPNAAATSRQHEHKSEERIRAIEFQHTETLYLGLRL